ncbi:MAG: hypothetical protein II431_02625 [Prevotella sp.]|nr:hypothetical protein [Prevotella sp.]MBQ2130213.1 hypothetical protein [Prevotella sp.]
MTQYIEKAALVAEIERRIKELEPFKTEDNLRAHGAIAGYYQILSFIRTLEVKEDKWNKVNIKPPFVEEVDGNKYSKEVLCRYESGGYCIAQYIRWRTGYCGWFDGEEDVTRFITHWKELKD